ncbi:MAG: glycosyltransferase family 2 protein [Verrucomicrobia bacterium]|nr:MAG: glycosyltransferase family 2 protein [Verrucomicrobiota bacterium]
MTQSTDVSAPRATTRPWITCVVPAYNEAESIAEFLRALCQHLAGLSERFEVLVIDDGSSDATSQQVIAQPGPIRLLTLSRNFGKEAAISAGLEEADGEVVVIIDADFQHPFPVIDEFIQHWQQGYDMVYAVRRERNTDGRLRRQLSRLFYQIMSRMSSISIPEDAGDFRLLDRQVVHAMRRLPESNRFMKGLYSWVGFRSIGIAFTIEERRSSSSKFNFLKLLDLATTGLTSFSNIPLRLWVGVGSLISMLSIFYAIYILVHTLVFGNPLAGWATLVVAVTFLGGVQLLSIGILGEYLARIFNEVKRRPNYLVAAKHGFTKP